MATRRGYRRSTGMRWSMSAEKEKGVGSLFGLLWSEKTPDPLFPPRSAPEEGDVEQHRRHRGAGGTEYHPVLEVAPGRAADRLAVGHRRPCRPTASGRPPVSPPPLPRPLR